MRQVHQKDQAEEDEDHCSDECKVFAPHLEEGLWDEECHDHECEPDDDLRPPISVLQGSAAISRGLDAEE